MYAKIVNNEIIKLGSRPSWYYPKNHPNYPGEQITDDSVFIQGGLIPDPGASCFYPISNEEKPTHDPEIEYIPKQKTQNEWEIKSDRVIIKWDMPVAKTLDIVKSEKCTKINQKRDQMQSLSLEYSFPDGETGHIQRRDQKDERNIQGIASAAISLVVIGDTTNQIHFTDEDNIKHLMTGSEGIQFGLFVQQDYANLHDNARQHKDAVNALSTVNEVKNYDYLIGWY